MNKKDFMRQHSNKQSLMLQKYRRIINLYVSTLKNRQLDIDKYCEENQVTERTLRRDIKLLKDIYTDFHIYINRPWTK
jgi:predicted DNA-binding transcriptional regulator YafY